MLETERTKQWRRKQGFRVFKKRMVYFASMERGYFDHCAMEYNRPLLWYELAKEHWTQVFKTTGMPCSCMLCTGERYNRRVFKRETRRILNEEHFGLDEDLKMLF